MKLEGIHHVTCITGDAPRERRLLHRRARAAAREEVRQPGRPDRLPPLLRGREGRRGLRHHVLRVPGRARPAAPAPAWCTPSSGASAPTEALDFWAARADGERDGDVVRFADPEGLHHELVIASVPDEPLIAEHPEIPRELALQGFEGVRAYSASPERSAPFLEALGFEPHERLGVGDARRPARRLDRVRRAAGRARHPGRRHRPSRRVGVDGGGAGGVAASTSPRRAAGRRR